MSLPDQIVARIKAVHADAQVELTDLTGGGDHWSAVVVSADFDGMSRLARQRSVYGALGELMAGPIHALALKTLTPDQAGS